MNQPQNCPCGSQQAFKLCCEPFINGLQVPTTAEQLMRSRYSAYATSAYQYIVDTYAEKPRATLDANTLATHDKASQWKALEVLQAQGDTVSFRAYYVADGQYYCMHEISQFVKENGHWRYLKGEMQNGTGKLDIGRNSACPCNSGKKFKRCCASA